MPDGDACYVSPNRQFELKIPAPIPIGVGGMDSNWQAHRRIATSVALASLTLAVTGCTTSSTLATAPRSNVTRDNALALAKHVAASIGGRVYAIAPSGSMLPTLDEGSIVTVEKVALDQLKRGDIVVYRNTAGFAVIHRLYERHDDRWFVLGDNNTSIDRETVSAANFLGRVCAIFYTSTNPAYAHMASPAPQLTAVASRE